MLLISRVCGVTINAVCFAVIDYVIDANVDVDFLAFVNDVTDTVIGITDISAEFVSLAFVIDVIPDITFDIEVIVV